MANFGLSAVSSCKQNAAGGAPPDTTAPTLSSPTDIANGSSGGTLGVTTNEGNGTLYWVVTQSATSPSAAQVQAGQDHTGSAADDSGSQSVSSAGAISGIAATGLTAETDYYAHFCHVDAATNASTVASADGFTTEAAASFSPADLFASTEEGVWFDPSDISTLWTDDGTTQAQVGDAIYRMDDKSGNGHHAYQTTLASRPILRQSGSYYYLEFDGTDDCMVTEEFTITGPDQSLVVGLNNQNGAASGQYYYAHGSSSVESSIYANLPSVANNSNSRFYSAYNATVVSSLSGTGTCPSSTPLVMRAAVDSGTNQTYYQNGTLRDTDTIGALGTPSNEISAIGSLVTQNSVFTGYIYQVVHVDRLLTSQEISDVESYVAGKNGATL